jgi:hypothetical protein
MKSMDNLITKVKFIIHPTQRFPFNIRIHKKRKLVIYYHILIGCNINTE